MQHNRDGVAAIATMGIAEVYALQQGGEGTVNHAFINLVEFEVLLVNGYAHTHRWVAEGVVCFTEGGHLVNGLLDFTRAVAAGLGIGAIDFGKHNIGCRWPGRRFNQFYRGVFR